MKGRRIISSQSWGGMPRNLKTGEIILTRKEVMPLTLNRATAIKIDAIQKQQQKQNWENVVAHFLLLLHLFLILSIRWTRKIPRSVVQIVAIRVGIIMSAGFVDPALDLRPMMVVGRSWIDVAFMTMSIIIEKFALPDLSSSAFIARMPIGVEALPMPSMFADRFKAIIF